MRKSILFAVLFVCVLASVAAVLESGWTRTTNPATARAALNVPGLTNNNVFAAGTSNRFDTLTGSNILDKANVKYWGAVGDGVTSDKVAFQDCISNAPPGGSVYIPAGIYAVNKLEIRKPLTFYGEGRNTILKLNANGSDPTNNFILRVDVDTNAVQNELNQPTISAGGWNYGVIVRDLRFEGNARTNHGAALIIERTEYSKFQNLSFWGVDGPSIYLGVGARELDFDQIVSEWCGSYLTTGGRVKWPALYVQKWTSGDGFEAINDIKFYDWNSYWSFAKHAEINSIATAVGNNSTTRFIKFINSTFHGGSIDTAVAYLILGTQFGMSNAQVDSWIAGYDENTVRVNGQSQDVSFYSTLFAIGGTTNSFLYYQNCQSAHVADCHFLGKVDGIATTNFAALYFDANGANAVGSYQLTSLTIDIPATAQTSCIPYVVTAAVTDFSSFSPQYNEYLQEALLLSENAVELKYNREGRRWTAKQGSTYNGSDMVLTYSTNAPTSKRELDVWLDATGVTNKVAQLWINSRWNPVVMGTNLNVTLQLATTNTSNTELLRLDNPDINGSGTRMAFSQNGVAVGVIDSHYNVAISSWELFFGVGGQSNLMALTTAGNLGLGTTTPGAKLQVSSTAINGSEIKIDGSGYAGGNSHNAYLSFYLDNDASASVNYAAIYAYNVSRANGGETSQLRFFNRDAGTTAERMTILGSNVGIGTTTPTSGRLVVDGGHFTFGTDNTYDIGASGANRPRTGYFGTSAIVPALAYDATTWNGNQTVPTRDDIRDKIESMSGANTFPLYVNTILLTNGSGGGVLNDGLERDFGVITNFSTEGRSALQWRTASTYSWLGADVNGNLLFELPNGTKVTIDEDFEVVGDAILGVTTVGGGTAIASILSATATLNFGSILAATSADLTITVTGAAVNDAVQLGPPAGLEASVAALGIVTAADTVTVRLFNIGAISVDPASATWRATVTHY